MDPHDDGAPGAVRELNRVLDRYENTHSDAPLRAFLASHSGLPGAHADFDMAAAFAEEVAGRAEQAGTRRAEDWWALCRDLALMPASRAPTDDPAEFLCICGTLAAAAIACLVDEHVRECLALLHRQASDPRWRIRDAVAASLTRLLLARRRPTLDALEAWSASGEPLPLRAAVKALTDPAAMIAPEVADVAAHVHEQAVEVLLDAARPLSPAWRTLRLALGHSVGALALARPETSLALLLRLSKLRDADARRIVDQNLEGPYVQRLEPASLDRLRRLRST